MISKGDLPMTIEYAEISQQYGKDKKFIKVTAIFGTDGKLIPTAFQWDEQKYTIIRILNITPMTEIKPDAIGTRYNCMVQGKQFYLFFDGVRWYIEK